MSGGPGRRFPSLTPPIAPQPRARLLALGFFTTKPTGRTSGPPQRGGSFPWLALTLAGGGFVCEGKPPTALLRALSAERGRTRRAGGHRGLCGHGRLSADTRPGGVGSCPSHTHAVSLGHPPGKGLCSLGTHSGVCRAPSSPAVSSVQHLCGRSSRFAGERTEPWVHPVSEAVPIAALGWLVPGRVSPAPERRGGQRGHRLPRLFHVPPSLRGCEDGK